MKNIRTKLFELKQEIGKVSKDSTNPFFKSKYMDINSLLEHVEPLLQKHKLLLLQPLKDNCVYTIIADTESKEFESIESFLCLPESNDPQKIGSAITYYRRYTLKSLLGIQEEDDDGNKASKPKAKQKLSDDKYKKALSFTKPQIKKVIEDFDLTNEQLLQLTLKLEE